MNGVVAGSVHRFNEGHVLPVKGKVENVQIGADSILVRGFGQRHDAALQHPAYADLGDGFVVLVRNAAQNRFLQRASPGQRTP